MSSLSEREQRNSARISVATFGGKRTVLKHQRKVYTALSVNIAGGEFLAYACGNRKYCRRECYISEKTQEEENGAILKK